MGTDHLKARCVCYMGDPKTPHGLAPGCPIHQTPAPQYTDHTHTRDEDHCPMCPPKFDIINKARHYNSHPSGVEAIDICRHLTGDWFNAFKYVFRADHKNGRQDIEKAIYYAGDAVRHDIPIKLSSWSTTEHDLLARIIDAEIYPRFNFFLAFGNDSAADALVYATRILESYDE